MSQEAGGPDPSLERSREEASDVEGVFVSRGDKHICLLPLYKRNPSLATLIGIGDSKESAAADARKSRERLRDFLERLGQDPRV